MSVLAFHRSQFRALYNLAERLGNIHTQGLVTCTRWTELKKKVMAGATFKQEMPPKGGYGPVDYKRMMPKRGPSGYLMFAGCIGMMSLGYLTLVYTNRMRRRRLYEEREALFGIMPLLEAEWDRDLLKQLQHTHEQEAIIMKDVPDWVVGESVYHTKRWVRPRVEDLYFLAKSKEQNEAMFGFNTFV